MSFTWSSLPDASSFVVLDPSTSSFLIQTTNTGDVGSYSVTLTATIETSFGSGVYMSDLFTFLIDVTDPCASTSMSFDHLSDMLAYVNSAAAT